MPRQKKDLVVNIPIGNTSVPLTSNLAGAKTNVIPRFGDLRTESGKKTIGFCLLFEPEAPKPV